jgi:hypothetical protein
MTKTEKLQAIRRLLGHEERRKGDEVLYFCPRCPVRHHKAKLSISLDTDRFHCWICGWGGKSLQHLLAMNGATEDSRSYGQAQVNEPLSEPRQRVYDVPVLPPEFRTLTRTWRSPHYAAAMEYLISRGLDMDDIVRWKLGYCESGEYRGRIIVPSFDERGVLNFCVGRAFLPNVGLSYKHGNLSKDIVWNDYMIDWKRPVVVTEGPFDAFKAEDNVVALQGSIMGDQLFAKIVSHDAPVYFAMDADALRKQLRIMEKLVIYDVQCFHVGLGGKKDVGSMTKKEFRTAKGRAIPVSSDLDIMKIRVNAWA